MKNTASTYDRVHLIHCRFDLAQFNPMSHMFDLEIFPGCVTKLSGLIIICKVSGPVDRFRIIRIQRILYECPPRPGA